MSLRVILATSKKRWLFKVFLAFSRFFKTSSRNYQGFLIKNISDVRISMSSSFVLLKDKRQSKYTNNYGVFGSISKYSTSQEQCCNVLFYSRQIFDCIISRKKPKRQHCETNYQIKIIRNSIVLDHADTLYKCIYTLCPLFITPNSTD